RGAHPCAHSLVHVPVHNGGGVGGNGGERDNAARTCDLVMLGSPRRERPNDSSITRDLQNVGAAPVIRLPLAFAQLWRLGSVQPARNSVMRPALIRLLVDCANDVCAFLYHSKRTTLLVPLEPRWALTGVALALATVEVPPLLLPCVGYQRSLTRALL